MSHDPLLNKMDALLKKHRGTPDANAAPSRAETASPQTAEEMSPPQDAWLPVLTDVVVMGSPPGLEGGDESDTASAAADDAPSEAAFKAPPPEPGAVEPAESQGVSDTLAEQLMGELEPRLAALLQDKVARQIRNSLDDTVSALLAQLDVNIREIVRDAINERLRKP